MRASRPVHHWKKTSCRCGSALICGIRSRNSPPWAPPTGQEPAREHQALETESGRVSALALRCLKLWSAHCLSWCCAESLQSTPLPRGAPVRTCREEQGAQDTDGRTHPDQRQTRRQQNRNLKVPNYFRGKRSVVSDRLTCSFMTAPMSRSEADRSRGPTGVVGEGKTTGPKPELHSAFYATPLRGDLPAPNCS